MVDPLYINVDSGSPEYSANELRAAMALVLAYGGRNVGARYGVRPGGNQLQVSLAGSTITVQPGIACVDPGLTTGQGPYWVALTAAANPDGGPLDAADPTNPRKDIVTLQVYDDDEDSSGLRTARTEYIAGTPGAVPAEPTVPDGAFRLATIDVPASGGGSPVVTNNGPFTVASGGIMPVRNQTERDALNTFTYDGFPVWRVERNWLEVEWLGTGVGSWRVLSLPVVTSSGDLSAITHPFNGQWASSTGDGAAYRYNGTSWRTATMGLIAETVLSGTAASVTFASIPQGYRSLRLECTARGTNGTTSIAWGAVLNSDTSAVYNFQQDIVNGTSVTASQAQGEARAYLGEISAASATSGAAATHEILIHNYTGTTYWKNLNTKMTMVTGTGAGGVHIRQLGTVWRNTAAITQIVLAPDTGSFAAGSVFTLYGLP